MKRIIAFILPLISLVVCWSQTPNDFNAFRDSIFNNFSQERNAIHQDFSSFRDRVNSDYADFLRNAWSSLSPCAPVQKPKDEMPVPPIVFEDNQQAVPVVIEAKPIKAPAPSPSPTPVSPIEENECQSSELSVQFYGLDLPIRIPVVLSFGLNATENDIASAWCTFSDGRYDNTLYDLLSVKDSNQLCDWAFLKLVEKFSETHLSNTNAARLLTAWLLCQSGYQIRIARDDNNLIVLFASDYTIFGLPFYVADAKIYYPLQHCNSSLKFCNAKFSGETPLSLAITKEQTFGKSMSDNRNIRSSRYNDFAISTTVNRNLIDFYNDYPVAAIGGNPLSRWGLYANTPFSNEGATQLYTQLRYKIEGYTKLEAVERLLNWVQTGFEYEFDDIVWGHDRAFFAEETLFYPYCDCEDRAILFSHLVRDLCGLDVALVYYPNHLATAVKFDESVLGDAVVIDGEKYTICDPTYIGASVGKQMPNLDCEGVLTLVLNAK